MQDDCAGSLQLCRLRVARLATSGAPLAGAANLYVTDAQIRLGADPEVRAGDTFELITGCGDDALGGYADDDRITRLNMTLDLAKPDPELIDLLMGNGTITDGGDTVGGRYPALNTPLYQRAVSIEAWTKAIVNGQLDDEMPYIRWVFPLTKWRPAAKEWANSPHVTALVGRAFENDDWGNGPENDWAYSSDRVIQDARDDTLPAAVCGAQALVAS